MSNVANIKKAANHVTTGPSPKSETGDWIARAKALLSELSEHITDRLKERPYGSLGVAVGLGILVGAGVRGGAGRVAALALAGRLVRTGFEAKP